MRSPRVLFNLIGTAAFALALVAASPATARPKVPMPQPRPTALVLLDQIALLKLCAQHYRDLEQDLNTQKGEDLRLASFRFFTIELRHSAKVNAVTQVKVPAQMQPLAAEKEALYLEVKKLHNTLQRRLGLRQRVVPV